MNVLLWSDAYRALGRWEVSLTPKALKLLEREEVLATLHLSANPGKQRMIRDALALLQESPDLSIHFFCRLHAHVKRDGPVARDIGRLRSRQNWIGPEGGSREDAYFFPPKPRDVKPALHRLIQYLKQKDDPLLQLAIGVAQFLIIHPFMDGNGRVARLLIPYYLMRRGLPPLYLSKYFEETRLEYLKNLYGISAEGDWDSWIEYFLRAIRCSADSASLK